MGLVVASQGGVAPFGPLFFEILYPLRWHILKSVHVAHDEKCNHVLLNIIGCNVVSTVASSWHDHKIINSAFV